MPAPKEGQSLRVIEAIDGQIVTGQLKAKPKIENGQVVSNVAEDVLKIALVDRYSGGRPAVGFIKNFGLKHGAIGSSVSHDSHNLLAVGADDESIAKAMNLLIQCQGGISAVGNISGEHVEAVLPLPIAGLMSAEDGRHVAAEYSRIDALAKRLGSNLGGTIYDAFIHGAASDPRIEIGTGRTVRRQPIQASTVVGMTPVPALSGVAETSHLPSAENQAEDDEHQNSADN